MVIFVIMRLGNESGLWSMVCLRYPSCPSPSLGRDKLDMKKCFNWSIVSIGKLLGQVDIKFDELWVKSINEINIKNNGNIWDRVASANCNSYWKKLNALRS